MVVIFGKRGCPYTQAARESYRDSGVACDYFDVTRDPAALARMLEYSGGRRRVPVIVEGDKVTVGFDGGT
jgi:glutaredoxin